MAPIKNTDSLTVDIKGNCNIEVDEGFQSPSTSTSGRRCEDLASRAGPEVELGDISSCSTSDNDSQPEAGAHAVFDVENDETWSERCSQSDNESSNRERDQMEYQAETLAEFIVYTIIGKKNGGTDDKVEQTLLRCVRTMMQKHEILLKGMMRRLDITRESGYVSFFAVANELFEGERQIVTWGRIVALYAFGGQLSLYCKENNMEDFCVKIATFMGKYASNIVVPYVRSVGGWTKICEEFPVEDLENKEWLYLVWAAIGVGLTSLFASH
ncbi:bcl-2-related ovarian killer protein homolog A-like isoform X2 [Homarus americanus]|uniref:bcl-2-related ovarian killer protein homolog A-like isoform X2 n=1 Tax=Homarus americanus TaxID=6706 RepID=UPI001C4471EA|nr:bcl-2-related ovarian killer protein homolog A-like isoform X2 [Homarus americanus]